MSTISRLQNYVAQYESVFACSIPGSLGRYQLLHARTRRLSSPHIIETDFHAVLHSATKWLSQSRPFPGFCSSCFPYIRKFVLSGIRVILVQHWNICSISFASPDPPADHFQLSRASQIPRITEDRHRHAVSDVTNVTLSRLEPVISRSPMHCCAII